MVPRAALRCRTACFCLGHPQPQERRLERGRLVGRLDRIGRRGGRAVGGLVSQQRGRVLEMSSFDADQQGLPRAEATAPGPGQEGRRQPGQPLLGLGALRRAREGRRRRRARLIAGSRVLVAPGVGGASGNHDPGIGDTATGDPQAAARPTRYPGRESAVDPDPRSRRAHSVLLSHAPNVPQPRAAARRGRIPTRGRGQSARTSTDNRGTQLNRGKDMRDSQIASLLAPVLTPFGLELETVEVVPAGKRRLLRVVVDGDGPEGRGPLLDDIAAATKAISTGPRRRSRDRERSVHAGGLLARDQPPVGAAAALATQPRPAGGRHHHGRPGRARAGAEQRRAVGAARRRRHRAAARTGRHRQGSGPGRVQSARHRRDEERED